MATTNMRLYFAKHQKWLEVRFNGNKLIPRTSNQPTEKGLWEIVPHDEYFSLEPQYRGDLDVAIRPRLVLKSNGFVEILQNESTSPADIALFGRRLKDTVPLIWNTATSDDPGRNMIHYQCKKNDLFLSLILNDNSGEFGLLGKITGTGDSVIMNLGHNGNYNPCRVKKWVRPENTSGNPDDDNYVPRPKGGPCVELPEDTDPDLLSMWDEWKRLD